MTSDVSIQFTPAEMNIMRQSLRAEHDRMVKQGYAHLAKLATETSDKIADAVIDHNLGRVYNSTTQPQGAVG